MRFLIFLSILISSYLNSYSQILKPVKWSTEVEQKSDKDFVLVLKASIEKDWHVYSQFTPDGGPLPLTLTFKEADGNYKLVGKAKESETHKQFNEDFGVDEIYFSNKLEIRQDIILLKPSIKIIALNIDGQSCKTGCINFNEDVSFSIKDAKPTTTKETKNTDKVSVVNATDTTKENISKSGKVVVAKESSTGKNNIKTTPANAPDNNRALWKIFLIAFISGFAALLTPCVFPMIPMTVSFFTKRSKTRAAGIKNAIIYGVAIIAIYVFLGAFVTTIFGADSLNALSTNVWFNILFFLLLIIFAFSFLGAFEIMLPQSWANKVDKQADRGGLIGIVFMALALAVVSFSCTGPIVGTLLVEAASKGGTAPLIGMFGFSLAIALPFMLFAAFPGWMNSLPKSGGWLNSVKVVLGFIELAFAFKFLSNADLVLQTHLLEREVFLGIWIAISLTLTLYLFGKISLPHDSPISRLSVGRAVLGIIALSFTIYMIPGLWGAPLKLINAFPPPLEYSESPTGLGGGSNVSDISQEAMLAGAHRGPHGIPIFDNYDKGLAYAKKVNKPLFLDFTGFACVNCRKMESSVWADERIKILLTRDVVVLSLVCDDKRPLPEAEQYVSKETGKKIVSIGNKWSDYQITKYKSNSQPLYVITDLKGNNLNPKQPTTSYGISIEDYEAWIKEGVEAFSIMKSEK